MSLMQSIARLLAEVSRSHGNQAVLAVMRGAMELTRSRHILVAVLNEELGLLEVRHGLGEEFAERAEGETLPVDIGTDSGIVAYVAATGRVFRSGEVREDPHYRMLFPTTRSEIAAPVFDSHGRVRAVFNLESDQLDAYSKADEDLVAALSHLVGLSLDRAEVQAREEALIQVGNLLDRVLTEEALVDRVVHIADEVLRLQACSIFLLNRSTDRFELRATMGRLREYVGKLSYARGEGFTGWVCDRGEPILLDSPQGDPRWRGKYVEFPSEEIAGFLAVPILVRGQSIGAIRILRRKTGNQFLDNRFTADDLRLLQAIAEQVAAGLENLRNFEKIVRSERMIAWGELSAKSSHMIGNRVFALKGDINELGHLVQEAELDRKALQSVTKSLDTNLTRVEEILQDFRDFVTATQLEKAPIDLNALVQETLDEVFPRRSPVTLVVQLGELPPVPSDAKKLRRAISELVENALNHIEEGELHVMTSEVPSGKYERTRSAKARRWAEISVQDSGPGVDPDKRRLIFQPFYSGRVRGMGLGLSIVKGIIDAHGGEVFEDGEPGSGARFVILLPIDG